jgi:hypothetical protein
MFQAKNTALTDRISELFPNIKRSSARVYASQIKGIQRKLSDSGWNANLKWYTPKVEERIRKIKNAVSRKNTLNAALVAMKLAKRQDDVKRLQNILRGLRDEVRGQQAKQKRSKKEQEREIVFPVLLKKVKALVRKVEWSAKNWKTLQKAVVLACYTYIPPLRLDWATAELAKTKQGNYVDWSSKKYHVKEFKNVKSMGPQEVDLKPVMTVLRKWKKVRETFAPESSRLFLTGKRAGYSKNSFGRYLSKCLREVYGKPTGVADLRKSYVTYKTTGKALPLLEREKLARSMLHSVGAQSLWYQKFD